MSADRGAAALLVGAVVLAIAHAPLRAVQREVLVERALHTLADGLERYRAAHGGYPELPLAPGGELARLLCGGGHLDALPRNPDTRRPYGSVDLERDLVFYSAVSGGASYRLEALDHAGRVVACRVSPGPD